MGRKIIAVVAGVFAAGVVIMAVELAGHELVVAQRAGQPTTAMLLFVAAGWFLGAFAGSLLAQRIDHARRPVAALTVAAILAALALFNLLALPHPVWFWVLGLAVFLPGTLLGIFFGRRRQSLHRRHA